jgi:hypothetical protein
MGCAFCIELSRGSPGYSSGKGGSSSSGGSSSLNAMDRSAMPPTAASTGGREDPASVAGPEGRDDAMPTGSAAEYFSPAPRCVASLGDSVRSETAGSDCSPAPGRSRSAVADDPGMVTVAQPTVVDVCDPAELACDGPDGVDWRWARSSAGLPFAD